MFIKYVHKISHHHLDHRVFPGDVVDLPRIVHQVVQREAVGAPVKVVGLDQLEGTVSVCSTKEERKGVSIHTYLKLY